MTSLLLGASLAAIAAATPDDAPKVPIPVPPPILRTFPPVGVPPGPVAPPVISEELRAYLETRGARSARFRYGAIGFEDYPAAAIRAGEQGTVGLRYVIGSEGRVTSCEILESSGSAILDATTCAIALRRFRFYPAQDEAGNAVAETRTQRVRYELPKDAPPPASEPQPPKG